MMSLPSQVDQNPQAEKETTVQPTDFYISKHSMSVNSGYKFEMVVHDTFTGGTVSASISSLIESSGVVAVISNGTALQKMELHCH